MSTNNNHSNNGDDGFVGSIVIIAVVNGIVVINNVISFDFDEIGQPFLAVVVFGIAAFLGIDYVHRLLSFKMSKRMNRSLSAIMLTAALCGICFLG